MVSVLWGSQKKWFRDLSLLSSNTGILGFKSHWIYNQGQSPLFFHQSLPFPWFRDFIFFNPSWAGNLDFPLSSPWISAIQIKALCLFCFVLLFSWLDIVPLDVWAFQREQQSGKIKRQREQQKGQRGLEEMKRRRWQMMTTRVCPQQRDASVVLSRKTALLEADKTKWEKNW